MQEILITTVLIFACIAIYQQFRIIIMETQTLNALKTVCETLDLIKKGSTVEDILGLEEK